MSAFTEFFKVSPDAAKSFSFFEKKNEEFYNLLSKHSMKALGVLAKIVDEVIFPNHIFNSEFIIHKSLMQTLLLF